MAIEKTYTELEPVRLNKFMAQSGICSRREADDLIAQGLVQVDGTCVSDAGRKLMRGQTVRLDTTTTASLGNKLTILYHKPVGIVSGQPEAGEIPAVRMITKANLWGEAPRLPDSNSHLAPTGRLDKDSRGLLILSEDGVVAKSVIGPNSEMDKEYHVKVRGEIFEAKLKWLRHGLELDGRKLRPAKVEEIGPNLLRFVLNEGRNRQIRRMCDMCELRVIDLYRLRIGPLSIGDLPEGRWRIINPEERATLIKAGVK